jgi:hypothetical protein
MPDRLRIYSLALAGWLLGAILCGGALAQNTEQPATSPQTVETGSQKNQDAKELLTTLKGIEAAIRAQISTENIEASKRQELRGEANLAAQQEMAKHTRGVNYAAWVGIVLSAIAVALLAKTMGYTAEAAKYAKIAAEAAIQTVIETRKATEAAEKSVSITELSAKQQIRAYINVVDAIITREGNTVKDIGVYFINSGQSPAKKIRLNLSSCVMKVKNADFRTENEKFSTRPDIAGGQKVYFSSGKYFDASFVVLNSIGAEEEDIFLFGEIIYQDVFEEEHVTKFRYRWNADSEHIGDDFLLPCPDGNEST